MYMQPASQQGAAVMHLHDKMCTPLHTHPRHLLCGVADLVIQLSHLLHVLRVQRVQRPIQVLRHEHNQRHQQLLVVLAAGGSQELQGNSVHDREIQSNSVDSFGECAACTTSNPSAAPSARSAAPAAAGRAGLEEWSTAAG